MAKSYAVVFAGAQGTSKSIIAHHLSCTFGLPIFSNDIVRSEVKEDMLVDDINIPEALKEYERRSAQRRAELLQSGKPIIFDGSVDRRWAEVKQQLQAAGYAWFLIDMELSYDFIYRMFNATGRAKFAEEQLPSYVQQHQAFFAEYEPDISLQITDQLFPQRLQLAEEGLRAFLAKLEQ